MFFSTTPANPLTRIDSFSAADFALPFLCCRTSAGVEAPLILLATTVLDVPVQEFWHVGGFAIESVVARICREGGEGV